MTPKARLRKLKRLARAAIVYEADARLYRPGPVSTALMTKAKQQLERAIFRMATGKSDFWLAAAEILGTPKKVKSGGQGKAARTKTKSRNVR